MMPCCCAATCMDRGVFNRFLTTTDARLTLPDGSDLIAASVMFVNRDLIAAISSPAESNALAKIE
jgi:hypothetical protein